MTHCLTLTPHPRLMFFEAFDSQRSEEEGPTIASLIASAVVESIGPSWLLFLVSSRSASDLPCLLPPESVFSLTGPRAIQDARNYIQKRLSLDPRLHRVLDPEAGLPDHFTAGPCKRDGS